MNARTGMVGRMIEDIKRKMEAIEEHSAATDSGDADAGMAPEEAQCLMIFTLSGSSRPSSPFSFSSCGPATKGCGSGMSGSAAIIRQLEHERDEWRTLALTLLQKQGITLPPDFTTSPVSVLSVLQNGRQRRGNDSHRIDYHSRGRRLDPLAD